MVEHLLRARPPSRAGPCLTERRPRPPYAVAPSSSSEATTDDSDNGERLEKSFLCARLRGLVHLDALVHVHFHVDDDVGLAEVVDEGRVHRLRRFVSTRVEVDLLGVRA